MIRTEKPLTVSLNWELASQNINNFCPGTVNTIQIVPTKTLLFPIRNEGLLKDSRASIRMGITHAVRDYQNRWNYDHEDEEWDISNWENNGDNHTNGNDEDNDCDDDIESMDIDLELDDELANNEEILNSYNLMLIDEKTTPKQPVSILKTKEKINKLLLLVQRRLQRLVQERYNIQITPAFKICIANTILQEFEQEDLSAIYNKLFQAEGKLRIFQIVEQIFLEKYPLEQLDTFYDQLFQELIQSEESNDPERPSYYNAYTKIWTLDRESYREYDYHCFVEYVEEQRLVQKYKMKSEEFIIHEYVNNGVLMNVEKFFYYFSRKVQPWKVSPVSRRSSLVEIDSMKLPDTKELFSRIMESKTDTLKGLMKWKEKEKESRVEVASKNNNKPVIPNLRFESQTMVMTYLISDPPFCVGLEMQEEAGMEIEQDDESNEIRTEI